MKPNENKKIRVLILDNELGMGGVEKKLVDFMGRSDANRYEYAICCLKKGGYFKSRIKEMGVPFYDGLLSHRFDLLAFRRFAEILRRERIDIVYTFVHPNTVMFAYAARVMGLVRGMVVSFHAMGRADGGRLVPGYLKPFLAGADVLLALGAKHKEYLVRREGLDESRITMIPNGVDTEMYRPANATERAEVRRSLGLGETDFVAAVVGSLKPIKNQDVFLRAIAHVLRDDGSIRILFVGDGPMRESLAALAQRLQVAPSVRFLGNRDDIDRILGAIDLLILPSRTEVFPNVLLEAMASGLPVISTDVGCVTEIVDAEINGIVVPPGDESALESAFVRLLRDATLRTNLGRRGREIALERYPLSAMCRMRESVFDGLLGKIGA